MGIIDEIDGLLMFLSNNYGTVTTALMDKATGSPQRTRFQFMFPKVTNQEGGPLVADVLHGNMALVAAKCAVFQDWATYAAVLKTSDANKCRDMGRRVASFDEEIWGSLQADLAFEIVRQKALQRKVIRALLKATNDL